VRDRILARKRRRATGARDPRAQLARVVTLHAHATTNDLAVASAPRASIQMIASCSTVAVTIDRDRPRPLRSHGNRDDVVGCDGGAPHDALRRGNDAVPPRRRRLLDTVVGKELQLDRREVAIDERTVDREQCDLGPDVPRSIVRT
jgi:hypothetical protein